MRDIELIGDHSLRRAVRACAAAVLGALAGSFCAILAFAYHPAVALDMDRDVPHLWSGVYPVERQGDLTFAWTSPRAVLQLPGLNRRVPWQCSVRLRGARPAPHPQPLVEVAADDVRLASQTATNDYQEIVVTVPERAARSGLDLAITSAPAFLPGPSDRRELGVQLDRVTCQPTTAWLLPPPGVIFAASASGALFGAALGLFTGGVAWAVVGVLLLAVAQALPLTAGAAPYSPYQASVAWIALWITAAIAIAMAGAEWWRGRSLEGAARFVVLFSGAVLFLKLLGLLHPSKLLVDALFHAHRFEWVLDGRYFFTQPLPSGVQFPYAIGLYVFASPWSAVTHDHVALLRIVVCASQAIAGALLYPMVRRGLQSEAGSRFRQAKDGWDDRRTAAAAVVLFHLVPLPYVIIGNANLTHAFAQSAALAAVAATVVWPLGAVHLLQGAGLSVLFSLAFLSHVGTFPLVLSTLVLTAILYRWRGGAALGPAARTVALASALAVTLSVVLYYGHFSEVYRTFDRVRGGPANAAASATGGTGSGIEATGQPARPTPRATPLRERISRAGRLGVEAIGWPILALAGVGTWRSVVRPPRHRLGLVVLASAATCVLFLAFSVTMPVAGQFQRYTDEFILRVYDATGPTFVILAACGAEWAWRRGPVPRCVAIALLLAALAGGATHWMAWWH